VYSDYQAMLTANGLPDVRESQSLAERLYTELSNAATESQAASTKSSDRQAMVIDPGLFHRALESGVKALGMANYFEVK